MMVLASGWDHGLLPRCHWLSPSAINSCNRHWLQADNQLLSTDRWQVLFCQQDAVSNEAGPSEVRVVVPALKLEMNCTPLKHYDAFDVRSFDKFILNCDSIL